MYTKHALQSLDHSLFRIRIVVLVAPLHKGWDPIWADIPLLVNWNIFLQFSPIPQPLWGALYDPKIVLQKKRPLRWSEPGVPFGCMQVAANRLYGAFLPGCQAGAESPAPTVLPQSEPKGFCGASGEATEFVCGHSSCLLTKRGSKQHRHRPKRTKISNMSSVQHADPGVPNSLFQGLSECPPPPQPDTQWAEIRQQWHQPLKTHRVGTVGVGTKLAYA